MKKRWYDEHPQLMKSVALLESFSPDIQGVLGESLAALAEKNYQAADHLKSIGSDKILGLYKSRRKRRKIDNTNQAVYQMMTYYYVLPQQGRVDMAEKIINMVAYIYRYLKSAKENQFPASIEDIHQLTDVFVQTDQPADLDQFMETLLQRRLGPLNSAARMPSISQAYSPKTYLLDEGGELRIIQSPSNIPFSHTSKVDEEA